MQPAVRPDPAPDPPPPDAVVVRCPTCGAPHTVRRDTPPGRTPEQIREWARSQVKEAPR
jgi:hypothetical protein